jgi:hypothetical protein
MKDSIEKGTLEVRYADQIININYFDYVIDLKNINSSVV